MPSFTTYSWHEGELNIECLKMEQREFTNGKQDTIYYICSLAKDYPNSNNVYIIDNSTKEYKQIGTFNDSSITYFK